jgi:hypothetical protein
VKIALISILFILSTIFAEDVTVTITPGEFYHSGLRPSGLLKVKENPQMAIWLEEKDGTFIKTIYVTEKTAKAKFKGRNSFYPSTLPIWMFKREKENKIGGYWPDKSTTVTDALTGATPDSVFSKNFQVSSKEVERGVLLKFEVNISRDFNDAYHKNVSKNSPYYSNGVNGQPSIVYQIELSEKLFGMDFELTLEGSGSAAGRNGIVDWEAPDITTARDIIESVRGTISK